MLNTGTQVEMIRNSASKGTVKGYLYNTERKTVNIEGAKPIQLNEMCSCRKSPLHL